MMLSDELALLTRTPLVLDSLLRGLPDTLTNRNEGAETWTAFDVVGHLLHGERTDWIPRARRILESGESRPFDPFDRNAQERESRGKTIDELLDAFARERAVNVAELRRWDLGPEQLALKGRHPSLGSVTLAQLLATWAAHDLTHLHQLSRIMAHQVRQDVGPWSAYLGVLHCEGHGA